MVWISNGAPFRVEEPLAAGPYRLSAHRIVCQTVAVLGRPPSAHAGAGCMHELTTPANPRGRPRPEPRPGPGRTSERCAEDLPPSSRQPQGQGQRQRQRGTQARLSNTHDPLAGLGRGTPPAPKAACFRFFFSVNTSRKTSRYATFLFFTNQHLANSTLHPP